MFWQRRIGEATVTNVTELIGPTHDPARVFADLPRQEFETLVPRLEPHHYARGNDRLIVGIQIWIVHLGDEIIVIDGGIGNHKPRGLPRFDQLNTMVPAWFEAAGAPFDKVTQVINTHLHSDHVGWNTVADGNGGWQRTFPNARYLMPRRDWDYWKDVLAKTGGVGESEALVDSVVPLLEGDQVDFYDEGYEFAPGLVARSARGHTPGQMRLDLSSNGEKGIFCADIFHSPLQILRPEFNTPFCIEQDMAYRTRKAFLDEVADKDILVMPCHFGYPHCCTVTFATDGGFDFVPEAR